MSEQLPASKTYTLEQVQKVLREIVDQVRKNKIERVTRVALNFRGTSPEVSIHAGYKLLGRHQPHVWSDRPYSEKSNKILATFKLRVDGCPIHQFNVTTGVILPEFHGEDHLNELSDRLQQVVGEHLFSKRN